MIWYLLYPFRGSTKEPHLAQDHPIRKAFVRHGTRTADSWLLSILLSTAIALLLCYPAFFIYGASSSSVHSIPIHTWTSTKRYRGSADARADVEMRQIWVLGDYMRALEPQLMRDALYFQEQILGQGFGHELQHNPAEGAASNMLSSVTPAPSPVSHNPCKIPAGQNLPWGFHSPLMYWNCSLQNIESHEQLLSTIHEEANRRSFLNITLRPSTVLAGKSFSHGKLAAADALVITLFDRLGFGIGEQWDERASQIVEKNADNWVFYPKDGAASRSLLFEFVFEPMSSMDSIILIILYTALGAYVLYNLNQMRAVKSKVGLLFTICVETAVAILASFTICGLMGINLSRIPREWYPFVVAVIGVKNRFRLVNAVLAYPPEMRVVDRLSNALGDVGHLSLATSAENLSGLWLTSRVVSDDVAALCAFAAIALVVDWVFHLTFFTAVLSVDIKRMELEESLNRAKHVRASSKAGNELRTSFFGAVTSGRLPFSTRVAGTVVAICFVLTLNRHFNSQNYLQLFLELLRLKQRTGTVSGVDDALGPPPINIARTPSQWLEMQDHETARDILHWVKPNAYSIIARVHEPLTVVRKGSDRAVAKDLTPSIFSAVLDLARKHAFPFALVVFFIIALIYLLMYYLTFDESPVKSDENREDDLLSIESLGNAHALDVVKIATANITDKGHLLSLSLDKIVALWLPNAHFGTFTKTVIRTSAIKPQLWPISAVVLNELNGMVALGTDEGRIAFWSIEERRFVKFLSIDLGSHAILHHSLNAVSTNGVEALVLSIVTTNGLIYSIDYKADEPTVHDLARGSILSATALNASNEDLRILYVSRSGHVAVAQQNNGKWLSRSVPSPDAVERIQRNPEIALLHSIGVLAFSRGSDVDVLDVATFQPLFCFSPFPRHSVLRILTSPKRTCLVCNGLAVNAFHIIYADSISSDLVIETYIASTDANTAICLRQAASEPRSCPTLDTSTRSSYTITQPGAWETTNSSTIIGIRKTPSPLPSPSPTASSIEQPHYFASMLPSKPDGAIKQRSTKSAINRSKANGSTTSTRRHPLPVTSDPVVPEWQVWSYNPNTGDFFTRSLPPTTTGDFDEDEELFVASPGPIARLGKRSVAVAMGNAIKVITPTGKEKTKGRLEYEDGGKFASLKGRKKTGKKAL